MTNFGKKLYKLDSNKNVRVWFMEYDDEKYRTHSGVQDGKIVVSGWKYPEEKNVGRANATSVAEQVLAEVTSIYEHQEYQGRYHANINDISKGAKFLEPMLAQKFDPKKNTDFPYWSQPKLDGIRCLTSEDGMQSRNGKPLLSAPHIREELSSFFEVFPDVILDGELYNHELKNDFEKIISLARKTKPTVEDLDESACMVEFHVYDVIHPELHNYESRMNFIQEQLQEYKMIKIVPTVKVNNLEESQEKLSEYLESGYEGQMLRINNSSYEHRRSKSLLKDKQFVDEEFKILDIIEGVGNWAGYAKRILIELENGETQHAGMRGNFEFAKKLLEDREQYVNTDVTIRYQDRTGDNKLRFPVATKFWKGKREL